MVSILRYPTHRTRFTPSKHSFERLPLPLHEIYPNERIAQVIPGIRGRFLTGTTRQSTFQPASPIQLLPGISWKSSIASWGAFPARRVLRIRQLIDRQPGDGTKGDGAGRAEEGGRGGGGVASRELRYEYIISPVPRDAGTCADGVAPPCPPPGPAVPLSTPPPSLQRSQNPPVCARANYTCATNQPASNEAGPGLSVALGSRRGFNHSCSHSSEPGWSVDHSPRSCFA